MAYGSWKSEIRVVKQSCFKNLGSFTKSGLRLECIKITAHRNRQEIVRTEIETELDHCSMAQGILFRQKWLLHFIWISRFRSLEEERRSTVLPSFFKCSVKFHQSSIIWGATPSAGVDPLCCFMSRVSIAIYREILEPFMLLSADNLYGDGDFHSQLDFPPAVVPKLLTTNLLPMEVTSEPPKLPR